MTARQKSEISEIFGIFQIYSEIMERHILFGKCPFYLYSKDNRPHLNLKILSYYKFWIKICIFVTLFAAPLTLIILRFFNNNLNLFGCFDDNVPINVFSLYFSGAILILGIWFIFLPLMNLWEGLVSQEIHRTFSMFQRLSQGMQELTRI